MVSCASAWTTPNDGEIFNLGNPAEITIRQLAERIRDLVEPDLAIVSIDARPGDPARRRPDISKIRARYGWEPNGGSWPMASGERSRQLVERASTV